MAADFCRWVGRQGSGGWVEARRWADEAQGSGGGCDVKNYHCDSFSCPWRLVEGWLVRIYGNE